MQKKILFLTALLIASIGARAENLVVKDIVLPQNTSAAIEIELNNPNLTFEGFIFSIELPDGVVPVMAANGFPDFLKGDRLPGTPNSGYYTESNTANFALLTNGTPISGTSGVIISAMVKLSGDLPVGTVLQATIKNIEFTTPVPSKEELDDITFNITIGAPADTRTVLDETSTTAPSAATGVDVRVKRTIKANEWSTLCLPFAMSEAQVKAAFGEDVQLADFTGYEVTEDEDENVVGIKVNFSSLGAIEANHPCLIRVSSAISEFTVDGVDIDPEEEPVVATVKRTRKAWSELVGTYVAGTEVPVKTLFLSGNEFWYSTGNTKMKAFRAYFDFFDVLTEVDENYANVRFVFSEGETTGVRGVGDGIADHTARDGVYTLQGVKVDGVKTLPKGVYVVDGKKVMVK